MFVDTSVRPQGEQVDAVAPASKVLLRAAELIEANGWCQHSLEEGGRYCIVGAINIASGGGIFSSARTMPEITKARERVRKIIGQEWLSDWNNEHGRTKEQVISVLRLAAQRP